MSEFRSPAARHMANRVRANQARQRKRAQRMREAERLDRERAERATPSPPRCVCLPEFCYGIPGETTGCTACLQLDPEARCLREAW